MSRRRFYVSRDQILDRVAILPPDQAHHLHTVLRLTQGDEVELIDGYGTGYLGSIEMHGKAIRVVDLKKIAYSPLPTAILTLAPALIKSDKFEWMIQKATELGVHEIIPLRTRHCEIRLSEAKVEARLERWQRIARESAKQCRRLTIPRVRPAMAFSDFLQDECISPCNKVLFSEKSSEPLDGGSLAPERTILCIGPEGGWEEGELDAAAQAHFRIVSLGPLILRAETAALVAITLIQFRTGMPGHQKMRS